MYYLWTSLEQKKSASIRVAMGTKAELLPYKKIVLAVLTSIKRLFPSLTLRSKSPCRRLVSLLLYQRCAFKLPVTLFHISCDAWVPVWLEAAGPPRLRWSVPAAPGKSFSIWSPYLWWHLTTVPMKTVMPRGRKTAGRQDHADRRAQSECKHAHVNIAGGITTAQCSLENIRKRHQAPV